MVFCWWRSDHHGGAPEELRMEEKQYTFCINIDVTTKMKPAGGKVCTFSVFPGHNVRLRLGSPLSMEWGRMLGCTGCCSLLCLPSSLCLAGAPILLTQTKWSVLGAVNETPTPHPEEFSGGLGIEISIKQPLVLQHHRADSYTQTSKGWLSCLTVCVCLLQRSMGSIMATPTAMMMMMMMTNFSWEFLMERMLESSVEFCLWPVLLSWWHCTIERGTSCDRFCCSIFPSHDGCDWLAIIWLVWL